MAQKQGPVRWQLALLAAVVSAALSTMSTADDQHPKVDDLVKSLIDLTDSQAEKIPNLISRLDQIGLSADHHVQTLTRLLASRNRTVRQIAMERLIESPKRSLPTLCTELGRSNGGTNDQLVGRYLDVIRQIGINQPIAMGAVASLLPEDSVIYKNRDKLQVFRLRAHCVAVLSEIGIPREASPYIVDLIVNADDSEPAVGPAAAARAAGQLGVSARQLVPSLVQLLDIEFADNQFCLEKYGPEFPSAEQTSIELEVIVAIGKIQPKPEPTLFAILQRYSKATDATQQPLAKAVREAKSAIIRRGGQ